MQRQQGLQQVHVRVLLAVAEPDRDRVLKTAMRSLAHRGEGGFAVERAPGPGQRFVRAGCTAYQARANSTKALS